MPTANITIEISPQACADIMCTALEGGIGYWAQADQIKRDANGDYVMCRLCECDGDENFDWEVAKKEGRVHTLHIDADAADCIVQAALLNEIRYG
jgi:hypothetical protein